MFCRLNLSSRRTEVARAGLAPLHQGPLLLHDDPGVRPGQALDALALGIREPVGEEVDPGQLVGLALHRVLGRLVSLPDDDDHERHQHGVHDADDRVDKAGDVVVLLPEARGHQALHQDQP
jgi:hypothetical protein